jgi:hypothetical protein
MIPSEPDRKRLSARSDSLMPYEQLYTEYRSKKFPVTTSFFLEHQKYQANYASIVISLGLLAGYFQLLDHQLSGYGLVLFVFLLYMTVNLVTFFLMDTVFVRIVINPVGLTANTLSQVLSSTTPDRALRIMHVKQSPDTIQITTDDRIITLKRSDWPRFDELVDDLKLAHENGNATKYKVFR